MKAQRRSMCCMIAARIARRSLMDRLLLDGMEWTDAHPSFGLIGAALTILLGLVLEKAFP